MTTPPASSNSSARRKPRAGYASGEETPMAPRIREPSQRTDGFSKLALTTFQQMLNLERRCDCDDGKCDACREWWNKHRTLMRELELPPWCFPCVERPDEPCPFPEGSPQAKTREPDHEAQARWGRLEAACRKT